MISAQRWRKNEIAPVTFRQLEGFPPSRREVSETSYRLREGYKYKCISGAVWTTAFLSPDLLHLPHFFSVRMVNFRDPAVEITDDCACGFIAVSGKFESVLNGFFSKVMLVKFWHVMIGLFLWVCLAPTFCCYRIALTQRLLFPAGSSSRVLTLSGVSSKDIAATGGRSGSVVITPLSRFPRFWAVGELMLL
jgi:hypothetical protein